MHQYGNNMSDQESRHGPECVGVKLERPAQGRPARAARVGGLRPAENSLLRKELAHLSVT